MGPKVILITENSKCHPVSQVRRVLKEHTMRYICSRRLEINSLTIQSNATSVEVVGVQ